MQIFDYPYVIITILVMVFILLGLVGLYFTIKSIKTAEGTEEKSFCGIGKIENEFEKAGEAGRNRCLIYASVSLDSMEKLYSSSKAVRMYERIKKNMLTHFCFNAGGEISLYETETFIALNNFNAEEAARYIEKSFNDIHEIFLRHGAVNMVHIHFGYYCTSSTDVQFMTALGRAKQAYNMAEDKNELYCQWDNANGKEFERKLKIESNIQNEIDNNRFFLEYQPILDAKTDKIMGAEVLSRLNSQTEGILSPRFFLSAVNSVGLNEKFDYYIFEKTCKWISSDKENRMNFVYTINFSRFSLCDPILAETIISIVENYGIDFSCIAIEILEDKDLNDTEKDNLIKNISTLKDKGVLILLDDFGKGYTSFGDLTDFDINIVKIDKSIVQSAETQTGFLILKNIIRTAHELGFKTLCEGIETAEQKALATEADCDMLQGYFLYRPMPVAQFEMLEK